MVSEVLAPLGCFCHTDIRYTEFVSKFKSKLGNLLLKPIGQTTSLSFSVTNQSCTTQAMAPKAFTTFVYAIYILAYQLDTHWTSCWEKLLLKVVGQHHPHDISQPARGLPTRTMAINASTTFEDSLHVIAP